MTTSEEWRVVLSHPSYEASSLGRIRHTRSGKVLEAKQAPNGYQRVSILTRGRRKAMPVYLLVAEAFLGPRAERAVVNHIDGNKRHNEPANLEWITIGENVQHAWRSGLMRKK